LRPVAGLATQTQCGFADAAHATRTFKAALGMTPRDCRPLAPHHAAGTENSFEISSPSKN
jgi:AraC-like DNA-binding protein